MKRKAQRFIVVWILLFSLPYTAYAGVSATQSFKVSVTLPAVVGLNVFPQEQSIGKFAANSEQNIIKEEISRAGQSLVLETIVLK
jgi:hypothetical protein